MQNLSVNGRYYYVVLSRSVKCQVFLPLYWLFDGPHSEDNIHLFHSFTIETSFPFCQASVIFHCVSSIVCVKYMNVSYEL